MVFLNYCKKEKKWHKININRSQSALIFILVILKNKEDNAKEKV